MGREAYEKTVERMARAGVPEDQARRRAARIAEQSDRKRGESGRVAQTSPGESRSAHGLPSMHEFFGGELPEDVGAVLRRANYVTAGRVDPDAPSEVRKKMRERQK